MTIGATTGGANNTAGFTATAPTAANSGTPVNVNIGNVVTLPAEGGPNVGNYATTLACTGGHTLSGTNGQQANTLTITSTNAAVCTYTNTPTAADLQIAKTNDATNVVSGGQTTYTVVASNAGPAGADGAIVRDTPTSGLNGCAVTACTPGGGASCPATPNDLLATGGAAIPAFPAGGSVTFAVVCNVN